jgi:hypothetical protein
MYRLIYSQTWRQLEVSGKLHVPAALCSGKGPQCPMDRPHNQSGTHAEEKIMPLGRPKQQPL